MVKAYDIKWNIDMEEVYEKLDDMTCERAASELGIPENIYKNMTTEEKHDYAYDQFRHNRLDLYDFMCAPSFVIVPEEMEYNEEAISDWLSDTYGWCHTGFKLSSD